MSGVIGFFLGAVISAITVALVLSSFHFEAEEAYRAGFKDGKRSVRNEESRYKLNFKMGSLLK